MKRLILLSFICVFITVSVCGQRYRGKDNSWKKYRHHIIFGIGATNFLGELGGANTIGSTAWSMRDFDFPSVRPDFHIGYMYILSKHFDVKGNLTLAYIGGNDNLTKEVFRHNRNLNFRSQLIELSGQIEYYYTFKKKGQQYGLNIRGWRNYSVTPYFFLGIGGMYFNPKQKYNGTWYKLKPLSTEGQGLVDSRKQYHLFQVVLPYGLGIRFGFGKKWIIGFEYGMRWTFTDYMDDVSTTYFDTDELLSAKGQIAVDLANPALAQIPGEQFYNTTLAGQQRGDPRDKDSYVFGLLSVYYRIERGFVPKLRF